jgi:NAD+ kinase
MNSRFAHIVVNPTRPEAIAAATEISEVLQASDFSITTSSQVSIKGVNRVELTDSFDAEIVVVFGGDGTILRGAEVSRTRNIPLLGVNVGHVGFMAEVERPTSAAIAKSIVSKSYAVEDRMVLGYQISRGGKNIADGWALNEVTVERDGTTMVELFVQIDDRPLSRWGCDGVICATPTGSTAYAFSAGGPVLWPEIDALVLLPISAHALFSRPMVVSPKSKIVIEVESEDALLSADALRRHSLQKGDLVLATRGQGSIKLAHVQQTLFTDRLVAKFKLPVEGWRGE